LVDDILVCHVAQHHSSREYSKHVGSLSHSTHPSFVTDQIPLYKKKKGEEEVNYIIKYISTGKAIQHIVLHHKITL
jgi:hypothetical protein